MAKVSAITPKNAIVVTAFQKIARFRRVSKYLRS